MMIRGGTALLYAHWEGFVKAASRLYVEYVSQKKLKYEELSGAFLGLALKSKITALAEAKSATIHTDFAMVIRNDMGLQAPLKAALIDTGANLSSARFRDIVKRLGLDYTRYELREQLIDVRLLAARNAIAHGQAVETALTDFLDLQNQIERLIVEYRDDLLVAARVSSYRAQPVSM